MFPEGNECVSLFGDSLINLGCEMGQEVVLFIQFHRRTKKIRIKDTSEGCERKGKMYS